ncbi:DUF2264 domain-containing protein [Agromyces albus]|uniref:DUF2264 domain-containing protein n=1 Tax=Agromyces albus TaxID=205332 RepID=A0A4Q2KV01_9MICO|nr:DUF2264 domain-containing protein [Agromyces albus]
MARRASARVRDHPGRREGERVNRRSTEHSPITGWDREHWLALADRMLEAARLVASPRHALLRFPGTPGGFGAEVDALEGFARTFMLAAFRVAGSPETTGALAAWYAEGLDAGTDPDSPERWLRPDEVEQAKVEAAALAIGLHLTRDVIWANLDERVQAQIVDYLSTFVGGTHPPNNWAWFRVVVEQFLASVGAPHSRGDIEADLDQLDTFFRDGGWISDGVQRSFDHYTGWALHFYPVIWETMLEADDPNRVRLPKYRAALDEYLVDAVHLIGADGGPLIQGRSLTYRFAAAAPFWAGALANTEAVPPGLLRRAASGIVSHFASHRAPDDDGRLSLGWHHAWRPTAQNYSGTGSPYWAAKGMLGIALPESHPVWTAVEEPLPVERGDVLRRITAPGWLVAGTPADGIVRVVNHGTDHGDAGTFGIDAPLYAKFGYSTATAPLLAGPSSRRLPDQSVAVVAGGVASDRSGFTTHVVDVVECDDGTPAGWAVSETTAHWVDDAPERPDYGTPWPGGTVRKGPRLTTASLVRGAWEVRFVRVARDPEQVVDGDELRVAGWPVSGDEIESSCSPRGAVATSSRLESRIVAIAGFTTSGRQLDDDATFLGPHSGTPWLAAPIPDDGGWLVAAIGLAGVTLGSAPTVAVSDDSATADVLWDDGARSAITLPESVASSAE